MNLITRAEWGSAYPRASTRIPGPVYGVTCHWEGPHMGDFPHSVCARKVKSIQRFHKITRGWADIAYSAMVCPHGYVYDGRGPGIRSAANGVSSIGGNDQWYAVCYLGGVGDGFTAAGKHGMSDAITWLRAKGGAGDKVNGHRDHHATECPGDAIYAWAHGNHTDAPSPEEDDMQFSDDIYLSKNREKTVREVLVDLDRYITHSAAREKAMSARLSQAIDLVNALPDGATKAQVKALLEGLDAEIRLVVTDTEETQA